MHRILWVLAPLVVTVVAAAMSVGQAEASTPFATCTRIAGTTYSCDKQLTVGKHVALNQNPGECHGDVVSATTIPSLKASIKIVERVSACYWPLGTILTITYSMPTPAPTPNPAVGGMVELRTDAEAQSDQPASSDPLPIGASVALGVLVLGAGSLYVVKLRRG